jgi:hypothetical protein
MDGCIAMSFIMSNIMFVIDFYIWEQSLFLISYFNDSIKYTYNHYLNTKTMGLYRVSFIKLKFLIANTLLKGNNY